MKRGFGRNIRPKRQVRVVVNQSETKMRGRLMPVVVVAILLVGVAGVAAWQWSGQGDDQADLAGSPTFTVASGPLTILVRQAGTIQAKDQIILKSQVEGRTTIIYLVPEGVRVNKGDLLVELDASGLQDNLVDQQIRVQNAEADFIRSRENLAVVRNQAESDIKQAELDYQFAQEDLSKYVAGEYPRQLKEAESKITLAREELERADEKLKWSQRLFEEKYISQTELESDRLARNRKHLDYELAQADRNLLEQYTYKRELAKLESDVEQTRMALERTNRKASANIVQAEAELRAKQSEFDRQKSKLAKIEDQIAKCKITAPASGMVVYATSGKGNWRGNTEPLAEGQEVRERQELIYLPTANAMMADIKVHEASLDKVAVGQPVRISIDALPGEVYTGRVTKIAPLPDAQSVWMNPDLKVYSTEIVLDDTDGNVRTGMTCQAEIIVDHYVDTMFVPVQAVMRVAGKPTVYVASGGRFEPRPIELGLDNNRMARVITGLNEGDQVLLAPPLSAGDAGSPVVDLSQTESQADGASQDTSVQEMLERAKANPIQPAAEKPADDAQKADADDGDRTAMAERFRNMTPEQREQMRKRFESMTPEQRQALRQRMQQAGSGEQQ